MYDRNTNLKRKYIYLPQAVIQIAQNDTAYLHLDNRGSPVVVTDEEGSVKKQYRYYAFGKLRAQSGSFSTDYSFTGYLKEETGTHYAKMRYYEGGVGRFLRPDPIGGLNPYVYCGNDPSNFVDPKGLSVIPRGEPDQGGGGGGEGSGLFESAGGWMWGEGLDEVIQNFNEWVTDFRSYYGGYNNINLTWVSQFFVGGTIGVLWDDVGIHLELGLATGLPGASISATRATSPVISGFHSAASLYKGFVATQAGTHISTRSTWFEIGGGFPAGASVWGGVIFVTPPVHTFGKPN